MATENVKVKSEVVRGGGRRGPPSKKKEARFGDIEGQSALETAEKRGERKEGAVDSGWGQYAPYIGESKGSAGFKR